MENINMWYIKMEFLEYRLLKENIIYYDWYIELSIGIIL